MAKPSLVHLIALLWEEDSQVLSFPLLPPHINSACSWKKRKTELVGEYHLLLLVCRLALVISTLLRPLLNVDSRNQRFSDGGSSIISGITELTANIFGRNWTIQMLIQLIRRFDISSPMLSSHNALRLMHVGLCR